MKYMTPSICFHIMRFAGPNTVYLNKELIQYTRKYKREFETEPLIVHYQLCRLKEKVNSRRHKMCSVDNQYNKHHASRSCRTSMYVEKSRELQLSGGIPLGPIRKDGKLKYSIQLKDEIIPASLMRYSAGTTECWKVTYWEVEKVWINDLERGALYRCLFG